MKPILILLASVCVIVRGSHGADAQALSAPPHPVKNPSSPLILAGSWVPADPRRMDFDKLPRVASEHAGVSAVRGAPGSSPLILTPFCLP